MDADSVEDSPDSGAWGNITSLPDMFSQNNVPPTDEVGSWAVFAGIPYTLFFKLKNLGSLTF